MSLRLGVNIDHVATIRNARGGAHPDPVLAAKIAAAAGADGITAHLREDRRHITDADIAALSAEIALHHHPHAACIVPERREERTTEGGLDAAGQHNHLAPLVRRLGDARIRVSLFIEPDPVQLRAASALGAPVVELHTGAYAHAVIDGDGDRTARLLDRIREAARVGQEMGLEVHAGHGLTFDNVKPIAAIAGIAELNIGHFLIGEAIFTGLEPAIRRMRSLMDEARA